MDGKRGQQHVAPNRLVFQEFAGEPAEAEAFLLGGEAGNGGVGVGLARSSRFLGDEEEFGGEAGVRLGGGHRLRGLAAGTEIEETVGRSFDDEDGGDCGGLG